jgi:D-galactarolactone isomerase
MIERRYHGPRPSTVLPDGAIDTQLHLYLPGFPARPGGPDLPEGLPGLAEYRQVMDWLGIDRFVVTQGNAHQRDNANLVAALEAAGDIARGVAVITGETSDAELERLAAANVVGARIMDLPGGAVGLDQLEEVDARAAAAGWMLAVQLDGSDISDHFDRLAALRSNWVFDHHGKFFRGAAPDGPEVALLKRLVDGGKCWFKFAGCYESSRSGGPDYPDIAAIAKLMAIHAPERIVWGTNFPHNAARTTADYPDDAALVDTSLGWIPDDRGRHMALVDNPQTLYRFPAFR